MAQAAQPSIAKLWEEAWTEGLWAASWSKSIDGLTAQQAAWSPGPGRHSIWQIVNHMVFWRDVTLAMLAGKPRPPAAEQKRLNFLAPAEATEAEWAAARERFAESQRRIADLLRKADTPMDRIPYHIPHDAYHVGQIMYLRAMQGLPSIE
jgi:hypothetical protein